MNLEGDHGAPISQSRRPRKCRSGILQQVGRCNGGETAAIWSIEAALAYIPAQKASSDLRPLPTVDRARNDEHTHYRGAGNREARHAPGWSGTRHQDFGHLERNRASMANDLRADLHPPVA